MDKENVWCAVSDELVFLVKKLHADGVKLKDMLQVVQERLRLRLSLQQLKRLCKKLDLNRRRNFAPMDRVEAAVKEEKATSGENLGYRSLWKRLLVKHKLLVPRDVVMKQNQTLDGDGVRLRKTGRLKRRKYYNKGPDFVWHFDGYDKLKPFGICIHGCIDGYSRRIMWLQAAVTNNDPKVIAWYYLSCVKEVGGCPRVVRTDRGTENTTVAFIQPFLRHYGTDSLAKEKSFWYGKSTTNQRIESWWGQLRKRCVQWWMNYFKDMQQEAKLDDSNPLHRDALQFCFLKVINNKELEVVKQEWNLHRIRPSKYCDAPPGIPNALYFYPQLRDAICYKCAVSDEQLTAVEEHISPPPPAACPEFCEIVQYVMHKYNIGTPTSAAESLALYELIVQAVTHHDSA